MWQSWRYFFMKTSLHYKQQRSLTSCFVATNVTLCLKYWLHYENRNHLVKYTYNLMACFVASVVPLCTRKWLHYKNRSNLIIDEIIIDIEESEILSNHIIDNPWWQSSFMIDGSSSVINHHWLLIFDGLSAIFNK